MSQIRQRHRLRLRRRAAKVRSTPGSPAVDPTTVETDSGTSVATQVALLPPVPAEAAGPPPSTTPLGRRRRYAYVSKHESIVLVRFARLHSIDPKKITRVVKSNRNSCVGPILRVHPKTWSGECGWNYMVSPLGLVNYSFNHIPPYFFLGCTRQICQTHWLS